MTARVVIALIALVLMARVASVGADPLDDAAGRQLETALRRATAGDPGAIDALEALGAAQPVTRWTDNAWAEAARLAERAGDYARARRDLDRVIALGTDEVLVRRARAARARLASVTGGGAWDAVAREHEQLARRALGRGDPRPALAALERLARSNPTYPRVTAVWLVIAAGWEREGDGDRALELLRGVTASATERERLGLAYVRLAIRRGALGQAAHRLEQLAAAPGADHYAIGEVRNHLDVAARRAAIHKATWAALVLLLVAAAVALRRELGSWATAARHLARPPLEVLFLLPVGAVLVAMSRTGNPLVARALLGIVIAGLAVAWISGALLDARRARRGTVTARRALAHAALAIAAVACATYLAVDHDRMLDLVDQTWEHGPAPR